ncbi:hypothetical protein PMAYCL1PPCAC_26222, partial [Pristionchus mayeri]
SNFTTSLLIGLVDAHYHTAMLILGVISVFVSLLLIYLILYKTPVASAQYRTGLLVLQLCFLIFDVYWCFIFVPLLSLPNFGIFCTGFMCTTLKVDVNYHMIFMLLISIETFAWFFICMLKRHQEISSINSPHRYSSVIFKYYQYCLSLMA